MRLFNRSADLPYGKVEGAGFVYVVAKGPHGPIKVGSTTNPRKRIYELESLGGQEFPEIALSVACTNYKAIEAALHAQLARYRTIGEWFDTRLLTAVEAAGGLSFALLEPENPAYWLGVAENVKPPSPELEEAFAAGRWLCIVRSRYEFNGRSAG